MANILGLDIGTNSIGWAITNIEQQTIMLGVHHIPRPESSNADRRSKRGSRRNTFRYQLRRKMLIEVLKKENMLPHGLDKANFADPMSKKSNDYVYELRKRGLYEKLTLQEIGRIFYHLNQRRGYKSNRKEKAQATVLEENTKGEKKSEVGVVESGISELSHALKEAGYTVGEYFYHLLQTRNYNYHPSQNVRKRYVSREMLKEEFDKIWDKQKQYHSNLTYELKKMLKENIIFYQRNLKSQKNLIGKCQILTHKRCAPKASFEFQEFRLWQKLNDITIKVPSLVKVDEPLSMEEKLIIAKRLDNVLSLELDKIAEMLASLWLKEDELRSKISKKSEEKEIKKQVKELAKEITFNLKEKSIKGNKTAYRFRQVLGDEIYEALKKEYDVCENHDQRRNTTLFQLWHGLIYGEDEQFLENWAFKHLKKNNTKLSEEMLQSIAQKYKNITLEPQYGNYCSRVLSELLPLMKEGKKFGEVRKNVETKLSDEIKKDKSEKGKIKALKNHELRNPVVQRVVSEVIRLINELLEKSKTDKRYHFTSIRIETTRDLKKTEKERNDIKKANDIKSSNRENIITFLKQHPELIPDLSWKDEESKKETIQRIELYLELSLYDTHNFKPEQIPDFEKEIKLEDLHKYKAWIEARRVSVYTGKPISLSKLFLEYDIDHILPKSRSFDDSFANKTLCEKLVNQAGKSNLTPFEYFANRPPYEWIEFKKRIEFFRKDKRRRFLLQKDEEMQGFLNSQLSDTSIIIRQIIKKVQAICNDVSEVNSKITAFLRKRWGLNSLLSIRRRGDKYKNVKNRGDHRQHAIDALVVALTDRYKVQIFNWASAREIWFDNTSLILPPWGSMIKKGESTFGNQVWQEVQAILVSTRANQSLLSKRKAKFLHKNRHEAVKQITGIRKALHNETNYHKINFPSKAESSKFTDRETVYVSRVVLDKMKPKEIQEKVARIVDKKVREIVQKHLAEGKKLSEPIFMYNKKGLQIPIKKVRIAKAFSDSSLLITHRRENGKHIYVELGAGNYIMGIYENPMTGDRDFLTITRIDAVLARINQKYILPKNHPKDAKKVLVMTLKQNDLVIPYLKSPDEIEVNWEKIEMQDEAFMNSSKYLQNRQYISRRLYKVKEIHQSGRLYLAQHILAATDVIEDVKLKDDVGNPLALVSYNAKNFYSIPIKVDILGNITRKKSV